MRMNRLDAMIGFSSILRELLSYRQHIQRQRIRRRKVIRYKNDEQERFCNYALGTYAAYIVKAAE